jgi:hypothetical protein
MGASPAWAQPYQVSWWSTTGGAASIGCLSGPYLVSGVMGQPEAGPPRVAGTYEVTGGFWTAGTGAGRTWWIRMPICCRMPGSRRSG